MSVDDPVTLAQREVLATLAPLVGDAFYLAGGVAIAARFRHRRSRDLDLFSPDNPVDRLSELERIEGAVITGRAGGTVHTLVHGVPASLMQYRYDLLAELEVVDQLPIRVASIEDLACMKVSAIAGRGLARDFWDLHEIIVRTGSSIGTVLAAFQRKYPAHDLGHVIRSLVYFGDAESSPVPPELPAPTWAAIRADFERWIPPLVGT